MTIISCDRVWKGEGWSDDESGGRKYEDLYQIISDDPNELAVTVRTHPGLPLPQSPHADDAAAYVVDRSADRSDSSRLIWMVKVSYERKVIEPTASPLDMPPKIRWTGNLALRPIVRDIDGDACVNSAGDYFDPPLEAEFPRAIATIQFNTGFVPVGTLSLIGAVNNAPVVIDGVPVALERARIIAVDIGEEDIQNDVPFRSVTVAVECRDESDEGYDSRPLDQGFRINVAGELKDLLITDEDGNQARPSAPVLLNGSGAKLTSPGPSTAVFLDFEITRKLDLTVFDGILPA